MARRFSSSPRTRFSSLAAAGAIAVALVAASPVNADYPQIRINSDATTQLQNEQQIVANPTDPNNIVACWRDFRLGYRQVGVGYSLDGGITWTDFLIGGEMPLDSDPVLIAHRDGTFYLVVINYVDVGAANQLSVHRSVTGGVTWEGPFSAVSSSGSTFEDKEWIAVDRTGGERDGHLYIAWSRFFDAKVMCVSSTDRGETWSAPEQVSTAGVQCQWPVPIVLANGDVLVAWNAYGQTRIAYDISTNGGATWGPDRTLTPTVTGPGDLINGAIAVFPYPSLALDETTGPRAGQVTCVYADAAVSGNGMDIWCRSSTDHGVSWSNAVRVNDDPAGLARDQFHPWVTCDEEGILHAIWYDRRDDPGNFLWHIYYSRSSDGGMTWEPNERITNVASSPAQAFTGSLASSDPPTTTPAPLALTFAGLIGEYSGVAARNGTVHPVWTDTRNGNQDTYTTVLSSATAVNDPAAVPALAPRVELVISGYPNPSRGASRFRLNVPEPASGILTIHHPDGRLVRTIVATRLGAGESFLSWDGRDNAGGEAPSGVYVVRLTAVGERPAIRSAAETKIVLAR